LIDGALQNSRPDPELDPELPMLPTLRDRAMRLPAVLERHLRDAIDPFGLRGHKIFTARGDLLG
jgi:hypothetical protein